MATPATETFADSLARLDVGLTRTDAAGFADALAAASEGPTVATPLPFDGVDPAAAGATVDPTPADLDAATTGVTAGAFAVADHGSVAVRETGAGEHHVSLFVDRHVAVVPAGEVVADLPAATARLEATDGDVVLATGPSATADMGDLVVGAHGPASVHVLLLEDR